MKSSRARSWSEDEILQELDRKDFRGEAREGDEMGLRTVH